MRTLRLRRGLAMATVAGAFAVTFAAPSQADPTGPTAFYFSADCTGTGSVLLTNAGPSRTAALQVVGTNTIILVPVNRGIVELALAAGTTCTFTGFGSDPDALEEIENPHADPVVIIDG
jgi:hypothetical protein